MLSKPDTPQAGLPASARFSAWGRQAWRELLDVIFPPRCAHCARLDTHWCADCLEALNQEALHIELNHQHTALAELDAYASTGTHQGILQSAIQALKYDEQVALARPLGLRLAHVLKTLQWDITFILPVPLHASRYAKRGYNQSELLAQEMAHTLEIPYLNQAIIRHRNTRPQVGLHREGRLVNVQAAFISTQPLIGQSLVLVDDVRTTGATLSACAQAARLAGAERVYALTVTHAI